MTQMCGARCQGSVLCNLSPLFWAEMCLLEKEPMRTRENEEASTAGRARHAGVRPESESWGQRGQRRAECPSLQVMGREGIVAAWSQCPGWGKTLNLQWLLTYDWEFDLDHALLQKVNAFSNLLLYGDPLPYYQINLALGKCALGKQREEASTQPAASSVLVASGRGQEGWETAFVPGRC